MMLRGYFLTLSLLLPSVSAIASVKVPEFGAAGSRQLRVIATGADTLNVPRDLAFNPDAPEQLWVVNRADDSTTMVVDPGLASQSIDHRQDAWGLHFMEEVSSIDFGDPTYLGNTMTFATCQESTNTYNDRRRGNNFMGPTLWAADLDIYARVNQDNRLLGSHIDMNHQSPLCMGIAHDRDNKYWVFDGYNKHLVYYDFVQDHGPGEDDHSDAIVRRYPEVVLTRVPDVPGHMVMDKATGWLYIADTGGKRVLKVDTKTGSFAKSIPARNEPLAEFSEYRGVVFEELVANAGLIEPSGIEIYKNRLFVSDHGTGEILAYDLQTGVELARMHTGERGIMGITIGPNGYMWYVNGLKNKLVKVIP